MTYFETPVLGSSEKFGRPQAIGQRGLRRQIPSDPFKPKVVKEGVIGNGTNAVNVRLEHAPAALFANEEKTVADVAMAKSIGELLTLHYAGHPWFAMVDSHQGVATIAIPALMKNFRYIIPLQLLTDKAVIEAGGHILERFKIPRSTIDFGAFHKAFDLRVLKERQDMPG